MNKNTLKTLIFISLLTPSIYVLADGNTLLEQCQHAEKALDNKRVENTFSAGACLGLVQGVLETVHNMQLLNDNKNKKVCFPEKGISFPQATRIVIPYLRAHPKMLHEQISALVMLALADAFPCGNSEKNSKN